MTCQVLIEYKEPIVFVIFCFGFYLLIRVMR